jgi:transposase
VFFEDLSIKNMVRNKNLSKSILDASWGKIVQYTQYKAENAGVSVKLLDPRGTSQRCNQCGTVVPKKLKDREHKCPECGLEVHRDKNSALELYRMGMELENSVPLGKREQFWGKTRTNASGSNGTAVGLQEDHRDSTSLHVARGHTKVGSLKEESTLL